LCRNPGLTGAGILLLLLLLLLLVILLMLQLHAWCHMVQAKAMSTP
jgi:hypothetical protein